VTVRVIARPVKNPPDFSKLKELLEEQETFPTQFLHKFVGRNTPEFARAVAELEKRFPSAKLQISRTSASQAHLALTYQFGAGSADDIVALLVATHALDDILVVL
jgi:putative lipoic acid-binding regulatory protein